MGLSIFICGVHLCAAGVWSGVQSNYLGTELAISFAEDAVCIIMKGPWAQFKNYLTKDHNNNRCNGSNDVIHGVEHFHLRSTPLRRRRLVTGESNYLGRELAISVAEDAVCIIMKDPLGPIQKLFKTTTTRSVMVRPITCVKVNSGKKCSFDTVTICTIKRQCACAKHIHHTKN